ncbi:lasso RiPP family leader peptide-containing protein [Nonomuraea diastatica]|uniref:Lasso RiPP family leader peptide-containing protein n=1 Tax=Nonomuraea diastatica TaxID=1848329 RepID=A0A4R4X3Q6_9ACTN|nr:lasso RiPP family leader peptide-containing protein [Nonomuraea diastatica]
MRFSGLNESASADDLVGPPCENSDSPYMPPRIVDFGDVRELTKGSSGNGSADANSQYYWG